MAPKIPLTQISGVGRLPRQTPVSPQRAGISRRGLYYRLESRASLVELWDALCRSRPMPRCSWPNCEKAAVRSLLATEARLTDLAHQGGTGGGRQALDHSDLTRQHSGEEHMRRYGCMVSSRAIPEHTRASPGPGLRQQEGRIRSDIAW